MKATILLEIDLEKDVPNLLAHIENRASTISGVRMAEGRVIPDSVSVKEMLRRSLFAQVLPFGRKS